jgi:hypothetical protein
MDKLFLNKNHFTKMIERNARDKNLSYIEAIIDICEENNLEPEDIAKYISGIIKDKLEAEARSLNFLPRLNTLPI